MGVADRKEREKTEMQKRILDAARVLFLEKGFEKTSIRNIADLIEYSPGTIYLYFKDKNEILFYRGGCCRWCSVFFWKWWPAAIRFSSSKYLPIN